MTTETALSESTQTAVDDAVAAALGGAAYDCMRVWSAWSYGTMGPDDFLLVADDSDRVREISDAAIQAVLQSPEIQRLREAAEQYQWLKERGVVSFPQSRAWMAIRIVHPMPPNVMTLSAAIDAAMEKQP